VSRRRISTGFTVAVLLAVAWWAGRLIGQHRRTRRTALTQVTVFPVRPGDRWRNRELDSAR